MALKDHYTINKEYQERIWFISNNFISCLLIVIFIKKSNFKINKNLKMVKKLFVFDFDQTIIDINSDAIIKDLGKINGIL